MPLVLLTALLLIASSALAQPSAYVPAGLQLAFRQDPTTTVVIDWHVLDADEAPVLEVRPLDAPGAWARVEPDSSFAFPFSDRIVRRAELTGLAPGTAYAFRFVPDGREFRFRTLPADPAVPLRVLVGGDVRHTREMMERTARALMPYDPHLVVLGGDLAYANGDPRRVDRWHEWFEVTRDAFVTPDGFQVPVVAGIGNHEVFSDHRLAEDELHLMEAWGLRTGDAPFYTVLFPLPEGRTYFALDIGEAISFLLLDTGHAAPIEGAQTAWLERALAERVGRPHVIPVYHVPAYPSVRSFHGADSEAVRTHWVPLFERYGVRLAFEHHDHAYKRTVPLRGGRPHPGGIVYLGDGAWGVSTRAIGSRQEDDAEPSGWYLAHAEPTRHAFVLTLHGPLAHVLAVREDGEVIDAYPSAPQRVLDAAAAHP